MSAFDDTVLAAFSGWQLWDDRAGGSAAERVGREAQIAARVIDSARPCVRVWENLRALVVTRRDRRLPRFADAVHALEAEGWPVILRETGGTAFPHAPGVLHWSLALPRPGLPFSIVEVYRALAAPVVHVLAGLGIESGFGHVPGSFCDGEYNLVARAHKLAGTSQIWRGGPPGASARGGVVLAHGGLLVDADLEELTAMASRFYALAGGAEHFDARTLTSVARLTGRVGVLEETRSRLIRALKCELDCL